MSQETERSMLKDAIDRLEKAQKRMSNENALRGARTITHLEERITEIDTGKKARAW